MNTQQRLTHETKRKPEAIYQDREDTEYNKTK